MKLKFIAGLMLVCFITLITSCEAGDSSAESGHNDSGLRESRITLQDLEAMPEAMKIINRINGKSSDPEKRNIYNTDYDFFVNTDNILRIDNGDYHSLTFPVFRFEDNGYTENLVLSEEDDGNYTAYLYTYDLTPQEKKAISDGEPTLITQKIKREKIDFDAGQLSQRLIQIWYTEVIVIECSQHEHGAKNFGEWGTCIATRKPQVLVITRSVIVDDGNGDGLEGGSYSGGSGGGGGGGTPEYNPNVPLFDPDQDMALVRGMITKPIVLQKPQEQDFYNNDLGGQNIDLRYLMNNSEIREPLLDYLYLNSFSPESRSLAVEILQQVDEGNIDVDTVVDMIEFLKNNGGSIQFNSSLNSENSLKFDNVEDATEYFNVANESGINNVINETAQEFMSETDFNLSLFSGVTVHIKQNKNPYSVIDVTSDQYGATLGLDWDQTTYTQNISGNTVTVDVYGTMKCSVFFEGIGTIYSKKYHFRIKIDKTNGQIISSEKV